MPDTLDLARANLANAVRLTAEALRALGYAPERKGLTPEQKAEHWKANDRTARSWEPQFSEAARQAFESDKRELLAILSENKRKSLERKATVNWQDVGDDWEKYLQEAGEKWRSAFIPAIKGVITDRGKKLAADFGIRFDVQNLFARAWFNRYTLRFAQPIIDTTKDTIAKMLAQAQAEGWSIPTMQNNLSTMFEQWMSGDVPPEEFEWYADRMPAYRTEAISRTETIRASNAGSEELYKEWGVQEHEWISTHDDRVREDHLEADGQIVPIGESFDVGGEKLAFPGDPAGSPGNTIQCRCTTAPVIKD